MTDLFGLELKPPKRTNNRPEQVAFLERINRAGGVAFVARDLRDVAAGLKPILEEPKP